MPDDIVELRSRLVIELAPIIATGFPDLVEQEDNDSVSVIAEALRIARCEDSGEERVCFFEGICRKVDVTGKLVRQYSAGFRRPLSKKMLSKTELIFIGLLLLREILDEGDPKLLNTAFKLRGFSCVPDDIQWPDVFCAGLNAALHRISIP